MTHDPTDTVPDHGRLRFDALIGDRMAAPFAWGANDCCMFAADCVQALTGHDPAAAFRGTYSDARGAVKVLEAVGGLEHAAVMAGDPIPPLMAGIGDVGLVQLEDRELLAVCVGAVWLAPAAGGLAARPLDAASKAWRVNRG